MKKFLLLFIILFFLLNINLLADEEFPEDISDQFNKNTEYIVCDPLQPYNRAIFGFNDKVYTWILEPSAKGYSKVIPKKVRTWVNNFFRNLLFPIRFVNNILQFKFKGAGVETLRFVLNTTIGVAGFSDIAKNKFNLKPYDEDFGQTLGFYHFNNTYHLEWPFIGPSNIRDTFGFVGDLLLNPISYIPNLWIAAGIYTFKKVNYTSLHLGEYEKFKKESLDFYSFIRDLYEQNRLKLIKE